MTKKLKMVFKDANQKTSVLSPKHIDQDLSKETVETVMHQLAELNVFTKENTDKFVTPLRAYYTQTINDVLFDKEETK